MNGYPISNCQKSVSVINFISKTQMTRISLLTICLLLSGCSSIFFFPMVEHVRTPDQVGLNYTDVSLLTKDGVKIHGWFLPTSNKLKGTIYFLHGNAENISTHLRAVYWLPKSGYQVFLLDYRGFGLSEGTPNLPNVLIDIETGFNWLLKQKTVMHKPVFLMGQSLGASMAIYFAATNTQAKDCLSAVISDAAFTRYSDITQHVAKQSWVTWLLQYPAAWSVISGYDPIDYIPSISPTPILLLHSRDDAVIPLDHSSQLFDSVLQSKFKIITQGSHGATFEDMENRHHLLSFLKSSSEGRTNTCAPNLNTLHIK